MNEAEITEKISYAMLTLYPGYFHAGEEKKQEYMEKLFAEIFELGLEELIGRILFMRGHGEK
jgi:hypothetical protein